MEGANRTYNLHLKQKPNSKKGVMEEMKKNILFATALITFVALVGLCPAVSAPGGYPGLPPPGDVYQGYAETTDSAGQVFKVWITVDTRYNWVKVKYEGHAVAVHYGFPGGFFGAFIDVMDDKGYHPDEKTGGYYGTKYFYNYENSYTWVYAKVSWCYVGIAWMFTISCKASVYVKA